MERLERKRELEQEEEEEEEEEASEQEVSNSHEVQNYKDDIVPEVCTCFSISLIKVSIFVDGFTSFLSALYQHDNAKNTLAHLCCVNHLSYAKKYVLIFLIYAHRT